MQEKNEYPLILLGLEAIFLAISIGVIFFRILLIKLQPFEIALQGEGFHYFVAIMLFALFLLMHFIVTKEKLKPEMFGRVTPKDLREIYTQKTKEKLFKAKENSKNFILVFLLGFYYSIITLIDLIVRLFARIFQSKKLQEIKEKTNAKKQLLKQKLFTSTEKSRTLAFILLELTFILITAFILWTLIDEKIHLTQESLPEYLKIIIIAILFIGIWYLYKFIVNFQKQNKALN